MTRSPRCRTPITAPTAAPSSTLHGTLNHILVADRIWMRRFTGVGDVPPSLDAILFESFEELRAARRKQDVLITRYIDGLDREKLEGMLRYKTVTTPQKSFEQPLAPVLDHFFNHQTHHRGQAHALLTAVIGNDATPGMDLIYFQRQTGTGMGKTS